jgi:SOS-response transcriptional repressor LexA
MPAPPKGLTPREHELLVLVADSIDQTGVQPTLRELARMFGYKSHNFVAQMVRNLVKKKEVTNYGARGISYNWRNYVTKKVND